MNKNSKRRAALARQALRAKGGYADPQYKRKSRPFPVVKNQISFGPHGPVVTDRPNQAHYL